MSKTLEQEGNVSISRIICTHWHNDHIGGIPSLQQKFGSNLAISKFPLSANSFDPCEHTSSPSPKSSAESAKKTLSSLKFDDLQDGEIIQTEGATLQVVYTPGHTKDHICLYLKEENSLFSGDCILGQGTTVFENLKSYLSSLTRLLDYDLKAIYPGHGPVIEGGLEKIREYISHRMAREKQIVDLLKVKQPQTAMELVKIIYASYPESLHEPAKNSILLHLYKLQEDGQVTHDDQTDSYCLTEGSKF